jgi:hypothetical protein
MQPLLQFGAFVAYQIDKQFLKVGAVVPSIEEGTYAI